MRTTVVAVLAVVALGACDTSLGPDADVSGTWVLDSVEGEAVPYHLSSEPSISISGRVLELDGRGSVTDRVELTVRVQGSDVTIPVECVGTFTREGDNVTLVLDDGHVIRAWSRDRTLTLDDDGLTFVMKR